MVNESKGLKWTCWPLPLSRIRLSLFSDALPSAACSKDRSVLLFQCTETSGMNSVEWVSDGIFIPPLPLFFGDQSQGFEVDLLNCRMMGFVVWLLCVSFSEESPEIFN